MTWFARWRHPVNVTHLVLGLAFLGIVVTWWLVQVGVVDEADLSWLLPVPWVLAGAAGLLAAVLSGGYRSRSDDSRPDDSRPDDSHPDDQEETRP